MTLSEDLARLSKVALFDGFSVEQLRLLAFGSKRMFLRAGEELFLENAESDGGYFIVRGQVDVLVIRNGREIVLANQLENSLIGELALVTSNKRVADAVARTDVELLHIPRELFKRMLSEYPELAQILHTRIARSVQLMLAEMSKVQQRLTNIPDLARAYPMEADSEN